MSILYKEISNSSLKGINNSIRKWTKDMNSYYTNNHMKIYLTLLAIREMQIQTTKLYHYILIRMAKIKKQNKTLTTPNAREDMEKLEHPMLLLGM